MPRQRDQLTESLFAAEEPAPIAGSAPLAARMRPHSLDELVGQEHLVGPGTPLRAIAESGQLSSLILWGPPGSGKTSLGAILAAAAGAHIVELSAVSAGVADVRQAIEAGRATLPSGRRTVLFIDEIHRFNKSQQDALLKAVENGWVVLVGATTENPFFSVNPPLMSRSLLFRLEPLSKAHVLEIALRALADPARGLGASGVMTDPEALEHIVDRAGGDARFALNALELCVSAALAAGIARVDLRLAEESLQRRLVRYDREGDMHYDVISAFIKSMRGSDPDAALFWLAQMLEAGEDPRFIARRMVIFASEDVGNADPIALVLAVAAAQALEFVGLPEAAINLSHAATYLATALKSNAAMAGLSRARADLEAKGPGSVPAHLRESHYPGAARLGHGAGYRYPHDYPGGWVDQRYLPPHVGDAIYYEPGERGAEAGIKERLAAIRGARRAPAQGRPDTTQKSGQRKS